MLLTVYPTASDFLARARTELEKEEAVNNLMIGISQRLVQDPGWYASQPFFCTVEQDGVLAAAALMTPPHNLILHAAAGSSEAATAWIARHLTDQGCNLPGVMARSETAQVFARQWSEQTGCRVRPGMHERVYELRQVIPPSGVPGRLRKATAADTDRVVAWTRAFALEIFGQEETEITPEEAARRVSTIYLWEDGAGRVVSLAGSTRETPHGATVGPVYTPPELRGHGYASACVAALSQVLLDSGKQFCTLFTDLANPISNHIYQAIGYCPLCDFDEYHFEPAGE